MSSATHTAARGERHHLWRAELSRLLRVVRGSVCMARSERHREAMPCAIDAPVRTKLVQRIRKEIARGSYPSDQAIDIAAARLLRELENA